MRIKTQQDLQQLGKAAQKALAKHLKPQAPARAKIHTKKAKGTTVSNYCKYPSPDPANWLHAALERQYGMFFDGGELARELIIPGGEQRWRFDWAWPNYRVVLEQDGYGPHKSLEAFKKDRRKQLHALTHGWVVIRSTNEDIRERFNSLLNDIEVILSYRDYAKANLRRVGNTQCKLILE